MAQVTLSLKEYEEMKKKIEEKDELNSVYFYELENLRFTVEMLYTLLGDRKKMAIHLLQHMAANKQLDKDFGYGIAEMLESDEVLTHNESVYNTGRYLFQDTADDLDNKGKLQ